jgi:hypothetical protein
MLVMSCSKDDKTPAELLQDGVWKLKDAKLGGLSVIEACQKDDTMKYGPTEVTTSVGAIKCDASDVDEVNKYTLSADGKTITSDGEVLTVVTLTESNLTLSTVTIFGAASIDLVK